MGTDKRLMRIKNTSIETVIEDSDVAVRIDNKAVNMLNNNPFISKEGKQTRSLVNEQLNLFYIINVEQDKTDHKVTIEYGSIGSKCKIPIVGRYSSLDLAIFECNSKMKEKLSKGYTVK